MALNLSGMDEYTVFNPNEFSVYAGNKNVGGRQSEVVLLSPRAASRLQMAGWTVRAHIENMGLGILSDVPLPGMTGNLPGGSPGGVEIWQKELLRVWLLNHNMGFRPTVATFNEGSIEIKGTVQHLSLNTATVTFSVPLSGFARCV